ncbi:uncharacterized protein J4E87_002251 [Alternaria ethzedia]|uniref:uncharacterized protein n=1 Tax=Alternaria ethzedia TaxID=181014 RepID=UPI0020C432F5|nr:uncharacterized protein J4E87_002251 [Alternaria ethzedia]KAI4631546.1 hypothetical protein J4E87_002251 [Alternaria ethzedia]
MSSSSAALDDMTTSLSAIKLNLTVSSPPSQPAQSSFEKLPLEVRQQIYRYLFNKRDPDSLSVGVRLCYRRTFQALQSSARPILWSLMRTSRQISQEVRTYFFGFYCFNLIPAHGKYGYQSLLTTFWLKIGAHNLSLIRKLSLPLYSIRLFDERNGLVEQSRLWFASNLLAKFPALTHLNLGLLVLECLPRDHLIFSKTLPTAEEMKAMKEWEWSGIETNIPLRECFEEMGGAIQGKNVEVGIYW